MNLKIKKIIAVVLSLIVCFQLISCGSRAEVLDKDLTMYLRLDETKGNQVTDSVKTSRKATVRYALSQGKYQDPVEPQWRSSGIKGGSLQFDGYSNYIQYNYEDFKIKGSSLTINLWVAPRAFEWNSPGSAASGSDQLTAFISQHSKKDNEGILLGMQRHGAWSFQVGLGDKWVSVWDNNNPERQDNPMEKYKWNNVVAVFDGAGGEMRIYKNGELAGTKEIDENANIAAAVETAFLVGKNNVAETLGPFPQGMFSGLMDDVKVYNTVKSEAEIKAEYQSKLVNGEIKAVVFDDIWFDSNILKNDIHKPTYHASAPQHWMNEPHAPFYYNGKYHLFYQFNPFGPYWRQIHWGHWVSDDMVNWKNVKEALSPTKNSVAPDGVWSGGAAIKKDGTPVLLFTAGDDSKKLNSLSNQNIGLASPLDLTDSNLTEWVMNSDLALKQTSGQGTNGEFRDPSIWMEKVNGVDTWFMAVCSRSRTGTRSGTILMYKTTDDSFMSWEYMGEAYSWTNAPTATYGTSWEMPIILPLKNQNGQLSGKYILSISPAPAASADNDVYYWIGTFNTTTCKFVPDSGNGSEPQVMDYGQNVFTGPSAFVDKDGNTVMFSIIQDTMAGSEQYAHGWAHNVGLARELSVDNENNLVIKPTNQIDNNTGDKLMDGVNLSVAQANALINEKGAGGDALRIKLKIKKGTSTEFGIYVRQKADKTERTRIYYTEGNAGINNVMAGNENRKGDYSGPVALKDDVMEIEIFLDRSIIEAFFNNSRTITSRTYSQAVSTGLELYSVGGDAQIVSIQVNRMIPIH